MQLGAQVQQEDAKVCSESGSTAGAGDLEIVVGGVGRGWKSDCWRFQLRIPDCKHHPHPKPDNYDLIDLERSWV